MLYVRDMRCGHVKYFGYGCDGVFGVLKTTLVIFYVKKLGQIIATLAASRVSFISFSSSIE